VTLARPIGRAWLAGLQMTVLPLISAMLVVGVNDASAAASGRIARRALVWMVALALLGAVVGAVVAPALLALVSPDPRLVDFLRTQVAPPAPAGAALDGFAALVPSNLFAALAAGSVVPVVVFMLGFAAALTRLPDERRAPILAVARGVAEAMLVIVRWLLALAPAGVAALILPVTVEAGGAALGALGLYVAVLLAVYGVIAALVYALAGTGLARFAAAVLPAQLVAAGTQSSLATLPAMVDCAEKRLHCPPAVTGLVLPLAVSLFRITSPAQYLTMAAFIAWAEGIALPPAALAVAILLAVVISLGAVGLPGHASLMSTSLPLVQSLGLPLEPLGLLLAVDFVPDIVATAANVTADLAVTARVAAAEGSAHEPPTGPPSSS
jgi:Na+/H+-dicarboxylate symporter